MGCFFLALMHLLPRISPCITSQVVVHHDHMLKSEWLPLRKLGFDYIRAAHPHIVTIGDVLRCPALRDSSIRIYFDLKGDNIARPLMDEILHAVVHVSVVDGVVWRNR